MAVDKVRENRARRAADRQGLKLTRSRRRDPRATDYGAYQLVDKATGAVVLGGTATASIEDVETYLTA